MSPECQPNPTTSRTQRSPGSTFDRLQRGCVVALDRVEQEQQPFVSDRQLVGRLVGERGEQPRHSARTQAYSRVMRSMPSTLTPVRTVTYVLPFSLWGVASTDNLMCIMSTGDDAHRLAAEQRARVLIDRQLADAGWSVQDKKGLNLFAGRSVLKFLRTICGPLAPIRPLTCANALIQTLKRNSTTSPSAMA